MDFSEHTKLLRTLIFFGPIQMEPSPAHTADRACYQQLLCLINCKQIIIRLWANHFFPCCRVGFGPQCSAPVHSAFSFTGVQILTGTHTWCTLLSDPCRTQILKKIFVELNQYSYMSRKKIQGELTVSSWIETENHLAFQVYLTIPLSIISTLN